MWRVYLEESEGSLWSGYNIGEKKKKEKKKMSLTWICALYGFIKSIVIK